MSDETPSTGSSTSDQLVLFPDIQRDDIEVGQQLGTGSYGAVFKGVWRLPENSRIVALKKVFVLEKEAEILSKIRHRNIVQFYGICKTASDFFIVTECAERGSLYDHIHASPANPVYVFEEILKWASQIANGIHYLHYDAVDTIIHRDLKSKNVVLDRNLICKICDFGTSKDLTHSCTAPTWGGTAAWMSPEMILQTEGLTTATDVWSFGVVLWEILSHEVPYKDFTEFRIFSLITQSGVTLAIPETCPHHLKQLMLGCWKTNPKERLTMKQILTSLTTMENNPKVMGECVKFMEVEDWTVEIAKQQKQLEKQRQRLEERSKQLEMRERAFDRRVKLNAAVIASAQHPPEDVHQWNEQHIALWIDKVLGVRVASDPKFLNRVKAAVFRNRITGARLLEMTQNDLEHIGVHKLGPRIELMKAIRRLRDNQHTLQNFPTLEQAKKMELAVKSTTKESAMFLNASLVLVLGMYRRDCNGRSRFKFFLDSDWDEHMVDIVALPAASSFIKTVCFTVLNAATGKPLNEPSCYPASGCCAMAEWVSSEDNMQTVNLIVNVHFADHVTQPRNSELKVDLCEFDDTRVLEEQHVHLKLRMSSSSASINSPVALSPVSHAAMHQVVSSPQLRGAWQRKAVLSKHALTEAEMASVQEFMKTPPLLPTIEVAGPITQLHRSRRSKTLSESERHREDDAKETDEKPKAKPTVHGGKAKWNWGKRARPKFV